MDNVPPRIERGFYIPRYGKRNVNSVSGKHFFYLFLLYVNYNAIRKNDRKTKSLRLKL